MLKNDVRGRCTDSRILLHPHHHRVLPLSDDTKICLSLFFLTGKKRASSTWTEEMSLIFWASYVVCLFIRTLDVCLNLVEWSLRSATSHFSAVRRRNRRFLGDSKSFSLSSLRLILLFILFLALCGYLCSFISSVKRGSGRDQDALIRCLLNLRHRRHPPLSLGRH